jgi:hypothetical protein
MDMMERLENRVAVRIEFLGELGLGVESGVRIFKKFVGKGQKNGMKLKSSNPCLDQVKKRKELFLFSVHGTGIWVFSGVQNGDEHCGKAIMNYFYSVFLKERMVC